MISPIMLAAAIVATSISAALLALIVLSALPIRHRRAVHSELRAPLEQAVFLFDESELVDATSTARTLLRSLPGPGSDWERLSFFLSSKIHGFESEIAKLVELGELELLGRRETDIAVNAEWVGNLARITVNDLSREGQGILIDGLSQRAQNEELSGLRETLSKAPIMVWRTSDDGRIIWANSTYVAAAAKLHGKNEHELTWPMPPLFSHGAKMTPRRQRFGGPETGHGAWYELHSYPSEVGALHFALPAEAEVRAETTLHQFIQTLTKTFADLPIGLAIFDKERQLALFNPALTDLTSLCTEFLSAKPTLFSFLDRLREVRVIPEPKNYHGWRQQMAELEQAAASGHYEETWSLPTGQTYKITGQPHPDGAVAFLLEDISAEISLTRHFRSEIELGQAVVDTLDEAIAVFSAASDLILSNSAYDALWQVETGATLGTVSIVDSSRIWQEMSHPSPVWGEIRDFVGAMDERVDWTAEVRLINGGRLICRCVPLPGGATLVGFDRIVEDRPQLRRKRRVASSGGDISASHLPA